MWSIFANESGMRVCASRIDGRRGDCQLREGPSLAVASQCEKRVWVLLLRRLLLPPPFFFYQADIWEMTTANLITVGG